MWIYKSTKKEIVCIFLRDYSYNLRFQCTVKEAALHKKKPRWYEQNWHIWVEPDLYFLKTAIQPVLSSQQNLK